MKLIKSLLGRWFGQQKKLNVDNTKCLCREDEECSCGLQKKLIFQKEGYFIIPSRDGRDGGVWRKYNKLGRRVGTWNKDLTQLMGK